MKRARKGDPKVAIGYLRVSTEDQRLGPEAQRAQIEAWAAREGVVVLAWHLDAGVSGGSDLADRPALVAALGELRAAGAGVLAVAKRDRLARDVAVAATIDRAVEACGARVVAADGAGNGDGPADALLRTILDAAAQYERALIRARTAAALRAKRDRGEAYNHAPLGYDRVGDRLVECAAELRAVAEVRRLAAEGASLRAICAALTRAGYTTKRGGAWRPSTVQRILARTA